MRNFLAWLVSVFLMAAVIIIPAVVFPGWVIKIAWVSVTAVGIAMVAIVTIAKIVRGGGSPWHVYAVVSLLSAIWPVALAAAFSNKVEEYMKGAAV